MPPPRFRGRHFYTPKPEKPSVLGKPSWQKLRKNASRSRYGNEKRRRIYNYESVNGRAGSPYAAEIESGLKSLQAAVGGDIQASYPGDDPVALICNEEGKLMGLPLNRALFDDDHIYDIVSGNFLIVGLGEENFTDLSRI